MVFCGVLVVVLFDDVDVVKCEVVKCDVVKCGEIKCGEDIEIVCV